MNLVKIIESFIGNYGQQFMIGDRVSKCILSSKGRLNSDFLEQHIERSGIAIKGGKDSFVMFCIPSTLVSLGDIVEISGKLYQVDIIDYSYVGDVQIYKFVVLTKGGTLS